MRARYRRWVLAALGVVAVAILAVVVLLHTPPVQRRVLEAVSGALAEAGVRLDAERLRFNLLSLEVEVNGLTVTSLATPDQPFLTADRAQVDLPWSAAFRGLALDRVEIIRPQVTLHRSPDGTWNLPGGGDDEEETPPTEPATRSPVPPIGSLNIRELAIHLDDQATGLGLEADPVDIDLRSRSPGVLSGTVALGRPAGLRLGEQATSVEQFEARLAVDEEGVGIDELVVESPELRLETQGRVQRPWGALELALAYDLHLAVAPTAALLAPGLVVDGQFDVAGRVAGPPEDVTVTIDAEGEGIQYSTLNDVVLRTGAVFEDQVLEISTLSVSIAGGELSGRGRVGVGDSGEQSTLSLSWTDLDPDQLIRAAVSDPPAVIAAAWDGSLDAAWVMSAPRDIETTLELRSRPTQAPTAGELPLGAEMRLGLEGGRWALDLDELTIPGARVSGQVQGALAATDRPVTETTMDGSVRLEAEDLSVLAGALDASGLVTDLTQQQLDGRVRLDARLSGTVGAPTLSAQMIGSAVAVRGVGPMEVAGTLASTPARLAVDDLAIEVGENIAAGRVAIDVGEGTLDGELTFELRQLATLAPALPEAVAPRGTLSGEVSIGGRTDAPQITGSITGGPIELAGRRLDELSGQLQLRDGTLQLGELGVRMGEGTLRATGQLRTDDGSFTAELSGQQLQLRSLLGNDPEATTVDGLLTLSLEGTGTLDRPQGTGRASIDRLVYDNRDWGAVNADVDFADGALQARVAVPLLSTRLEGSMGLTSGDGSFDVRGVIDALDLARLPLGGEDLPAISGQLSATLDAAGDTRDLSTLSAQLHLSAFEGQIAEARFGLLGPASVEYRNEGIEVDALSLSLSGSRLVIDGGLARTEPGQLAVTLDGDLADFVELAHLLGGDPAGDLRMAGPLDARAHLDGTLETLAVTAEVELVGGSLQVGAHPALEELALRVSYQDALISLDQLDATWQGSRIAARGRVPVGLLVDELPDLLAAEPASGPMRLEASIVSLTAETLRGYLDDATLSDLGGNLDAELEVEADELVLDAVRGSLILTDGRLTLAGVPLAQRRETRLEIANGAVRVAALDWGNEEDYFTLGGTVVLGETIATDLTVTAELDLRALSVFMSDVATEGQALLIANLQGSVDEPVLNGTVELSGVGLRMSEPRLIVSDLNGALFLTPDAIQLHQLVGEANGGPLEIRGTLVREGLQPEGVIQLVGRRIAMEIPEGLRTEVDTDLNLTVSPDTFALEGTVTVVRGTYREPIAITGGLLAALQAQETVEVVGLDEASPLDAFALDIRVVTAEDIVVDNNYAALTVSTDIRVGGTASAPALTGRVALGEGGELRLGTRLYEIERGTVDFVDPAGIQPELNVLARTRVSGRNIEVTIEGTPEALTTEFQSDGDESESDIVSLLLTGRTLDEVGVAPGVAAREQALGLASGEFLGTAGRAVGLDTVRVEEGVSSGEIRFDSSLVATETDPGARLTIGKNLSDQVQLIASQNLRESGLFTWIVEYLPRSDLEVRLIVDDETDRAYEFRHAVTLGRPARSPREAIEPPEPPRQIGAVQFAGEPGLPEDELRERLRLKSDERFDFYRWQRDRDRLEALYHDRGFLEARIRPRRREEDDGTVTLTYEIMRGPEAVVTIEGYPLPDDVVETMRERWTRAVFDGFLLDELRQEARRHLILDGFLQAQIDAEIQTHPARNQKEIVLQIESGPRLSERRIVFLGNELIPTDRLERFIVRQQLAQTSWVDPEPLVEALRRLYRADGILEAEVTVEAPDFEGETATLPVRINEGPVFRLTEVMLQGVEAMPLETLQALIPTQSGDVYSGATVSEARTNVDRHYRQAGFNQVRVAARSTVDREGNTVSVTLDVREGPRQVVEDLAVLGRNRTNERLVSRALRIEPGQPVDLGAWNQARRRLYDTGAFRSVDIAAEPIDEADAGADAGEVPVRARVLLEEWPAYRLRYGLQLNDEEAPLTEQANRDLNLGFVGDLTRRNFLGRAVTLGSAFGWDTDRRVIRGFTRIPAFFGLPITSNIFGSRENRTFGPERNRTIEDVTATTLEQRFNPRPPITVAYSYNFERTQAREEDFDPNDPFAFDETTDIARLDTSVVVDTRDDLFNATRGWFHSSNFEYAVKALGSDLKFAKYTAQQFHYWPLGGGVVVASAARLGLAAGFGQDIILTERYFAGGGNTVRGYGQDALGPLFFGAPDGGNAQMILNQEVRFPLYSVFRGVGFIDAGNVFPLAENLSLTGLKVGAGFGLRIDTPFGLFRLDFATPLSEIEDERKSRFFFSIGQVF